MDSVITILNYLGYFSTLLVLFSASYAVLLWARGVAPVLIRLGNGLSQRQIALFAKGDELRSLESLLYDSDLFKESNVATITTSGDISKAESATVFLLNWTDWQDEIDEILAKKKDAIPLIIYALPGSIPHDTMARLGNLRNVTVCNFRGRLLNDLVTSMITTSY